MILYVGCYTTPEHPNGLALVDFDCATGRMKLVESYRVDNPLYFAKSADGKYLYSNEADGLGSFEIGKDGRLRHVDAVKFGAKAMCHLALMPGDEALAWAAYTSGEAGLINVKDGRFMSEVRHDRHAGRGPDPRQESAHCHEAVPTPDIPAEKATAFEGSRRPSKHYVVVDLGIDSLVTYSAEDPGAPGVVFKTEPAGAGPRHLIFHPDGKHAFVVFELGSRIALYSWDEESGFKMLDSCSTMPTGWRGLNQDAAIRFTPDGKRVVVSNRGYDSLTVFDFDLTTGKLSLKARSVLPGSWPRDFLFIPGTDFAVVTMERSGTLLTVRYDARTGVFTPVDSLHGLHRPVAVLD